MPMTELDAVKTEVTQIRALLRMADSDSMDTRNLLKSQTSLMVALRETQNAANISLGEQAQSLGGMVIAINKLEQRVNSLDKRFLDFTIEMTGVKREIEGVKGRLGGVEDRLEGMDKNIVAIMRHLGI